MITQWSVRTAAARQRAGRWCGPVAVHAVGGSQTAGTASRVPHASGVEVAHIWARRVALRRNTSVVLCEGAHTRTLGRKRGRTGVRLARATAEAEHPAATSLCAARRRREVAVGDRTTIVVGPLALAVTQAKCLRGRCADRTDTRAVHKLATSIRIAAGFRGVRVLALEAAERRRSRPHTSRKERAV